MDVESELNLYKDVEFLPTKFDSQKESTEFKRGSVQNETAVNPRQNPKAKKNKNKKQFQQKQAQTQQKKLIHLSRDPFKLSANELLFFPKNHKSKPLRSVTTTPNDYTKKNKYLNEISKMSPGDQRKLRCQRDARYINKPAKKPKETEGEEEQQFCYNHLIGRCNPHNQCDKWHQLRPPRYIGVCKHYLSGCCASGDMCQFMHEDYPCRFYYLDLDHPKTIDADNCRFMHGGPLPKRLYYYFKKQIEMWVKKMTEGKPEKFDSLLTEYIDKFETKLAKLEHDHQSNKCTVVLSSDDQFSIDSILTSKQMKALAEKNITTAAQINQVPIDDLIDFGLTIDQIYTITTNTCNESSQPEIVCEDLVDKSTNDDVIMSDIILGSSSNLLLDRSTDVDSKEIESNVNSEEIDSNLDLETDGVLLFGFAQIEMREAKQILQTKRRIFQMDPESIDESPIVSNEIELAANIGETEITNQVQNINSDNATDDSDSEFGLIINEDV